jgi:hypothetical protein
MTLSGRSVNVELASTDMQRLRSLGEELVEIGVPFPTPSQLIESCVMFALDYDREGIKRYLEELLR